MGIDSHQHFWKYDPVRDAWITPDMQPIRRDFKPDDLKPLLQAAGIDGCVTIQVDQSDDENTRLLEWASQNDFIKGVVGWVDLRSKDLDNRLAALTKHKKLKGFRHIVQAEPEGFLLQPDFVRGVRKLVTLGFTYDILIYPKQLPEAVQFVRQLPDNRFVLDHLAKPPIRDGALEPWKKRISALASAGHVYCKLSGMVTEADWKNWKPTDFYPYLDAVLEAFGPSRCMYGSDWPVCLLASTYSSQRSVVEGYISKLSSAEKQAILGENAVTFYNI